MNDPYKDFIPEHQKCWKLILVNKTKERIYYDPFVHKNLCSPSWCPEMQFLFCNHWIDLYIALSVCTLKTLNILDTKNTTFAAFPTMHLKHKSVFLPNDLMISVFGLWAHFPILVSTFEKLSYPQHYNTKSLYKYLNKNSFRILYGYYHNDVGFIITCLFNH